MQLEVKEMAQSLSVSGKGDCWHGERGLPADRLSGRCRYERDGKFEALIDKKSSDEEVFAEMSRMGSPLVKLEVCNSGGKGGESA